MKRTTLLYAPLIFAVLLTGCTKVQSKTPAIGEVGDIANWEAWHITWQTAQKYFDVTVTTGDAQKTFMPEQQDYVFLAVTSELVNISDQDQEIRFPQGPIYITDKDLQEYDLVGIANKSNIFMAPPYLITENTLFATVKWDKGYFTLAYQPEPGEWYIQASPGASFHIDFIFAIPDIVSGLVIHFGNGMTVNIQ